MSSRKSIPGRNLIRSKQTPSSTTLTSCYNILEKANFQSTTREASKTTNSTGRENIPGSTEKYMRETGKREECMGLGSSTGKRGVTTTRDSTRMTSSMAKAPCTGVSPSVIGGNGSRDSDTAMGSSSLLKKWTNQFRWILRKKSVKLRFLGKSGTS